MERPDAQTVDAGIRMLDIVAALKALNGARVAELSDYLDIPDSTVYRHLATLHAREFVVKEGDEYQLGARFLNVGLAVRRRNRRYELIKDKVEQLAAETGEFVQFAVEEHGYGKYIFRSNGEHSVTTDLNLGEAFYLHTTAVGKAILSQLPHDRVEQIVDRRGLPQKTEATIIEPNALYHNLDEVRDRGVAFNNEERIKGLRAVATPVTNAHEYLLGAITIAGPKNRMNGEVFRKEFPDLLSGAINELEINLTYAID